jgi:hypothetical protein
MTAFLRRDAQEQSYCFARAKSVASAMPSSVVSPHPAWPKNFAHLPVVKQVVGFLWFSLYVIILLSLISYDPADLGFNVFPPNSVPSNFIGYFGASLAGILFYSFGLGAYLFVFLFLACALASFRAVCLICSISAAGGLSSTREISTAPAASSARKSSG